MSARLAQREIALAAVALLAVIVSLALASTRDGKATDERLPQPVSVPGGWYEALAKPRSSEPIGRRTACGQVLTETMLGISHPVLPCGAKLFIEYRDKRVLTQVIDRGPVASGHDFDLTRALARELDLQGTQLIRWTYAR